MLSYNKYLHDTKTGDRILETNNPVCFLCEETLKADSVVYFSNVTKRLFCKKCLLTKSSSIENEKNDEFLWCVLRIKQGDDESGKC